MKYLKAILILCILIAVIYGILWLLSLKKYPVEYGISFNQNHAESLGLDWKDVYNDMLSELQPKYIRIAAMWSQIEEKKGMFDYSDVDYMMDRAEGSGAKVILVVGQKAPRWPECHVPGWLDYGDVESKEHLLKYVRNVVERYKTHDALELWQVENEPYIRFAFGECERYNKEVVKDEIGLVKELDPNHKVMVTDSGELSTWRQASKAGDLFGTTLYRIVQTPSGGTFTYDWLPAAFYRLKAKFWQIPLENFYVAELQAEPWFTDSSPLDESVEMQEKTMNVERMNKHFDYVERIGVSRAYLWGVEWWYYMKQEREKPDYWEAAKEKIKT